MKSIQIGLILGLFGGLIVCAMTAIVVTFIVTNDTAIKDSIGTLVDNVMIRNVQVALRYVTFFETAVYQTATAVLALNSTALQLRQQSDDIGPLDSSTAVAWAKAVEPMWLVLSLTGFPSASVLATFELWAPEAASSQLGATSNFADFKWDGAGCVPISSNCFLYSSVSNSTMSAPVEDDQSRFFVENATVRAGPPSFLSYTTDFIEHAFTDVHAVPSTEGQWSPLYITPAYAVNNTFCNGKPTLTYLIFFVCLNYVEIHPGGYTCVHGVGTMLAGTALGESKASNLTSQSQDEIFIHALNQVDMMSKQCDLDAAAMSVLTTYTDICTAEEKNGQLISGVEGSRMEVSNTPTNDGDVSEFTGGVPSRSIVRYAYCKPRAFFKNSQVTSTCLFKTKKGLRFVFIDRTARSFFFGAADKSKKICLVIGCVVLVVTLLMCTLLWLVTTRPIRWICRGMKRAKTLETSCDDSLEHARWYTMIHEVAMLYTAYLDLRHALKELKAYVPQGLFMAPSDSSVLHPDAFMANLLGLDGYTTEDGEGAEDDSTFHDDDEDNETETETETRHEDANEKSDRPRQRRRDPASGDIFVFEGEQANARALHDADPRESTSFYHHQIPHTNVAKTAAEAEVSMLQSEPSYNHEMNGSTVFSEPESGHRQRRRSRQQQQQQAHSLTKIADTAAAHGKRLNTAGETVGTFGSASNRPVGAKDSKDMETQGIVAIFGTSASCPSGHTNDAYSLLQRPQPLPVNPHQPSSLQTDRAGMNRQGAATFGSSTPPPLWSGVPALDEGGSASGAGGPHTTASSHAAAAAAAASKGGIVTIVPIQSSSGIGSVPTHPQTTQSHQVQQAFTGGSSTTAQPMRDRTRQTQTVAVSILSPTGTSSAQKKAKTAPPSQPPQGTMAPPAGMSVSLAAGSTVDRSLGFNPSALQLDLTRTSGVNQFRAITCSFVFIAFSFRFIDTDNLGKDVSKLMDVIVRSTLRLGGVLEIFRPDLVAISFGAQATQSQHLQRAITCAASIAKMSSSKLSARTRMLVDSGAYFVGSCGAHERISRVVFGDRFDFDLDLLKHEVLLGRVILTDRVAVCLPVGAVTPVDYVIPLRDRTQGTQLFHLLDPKKARDKLYRQGARQFRAAFMHALSGNYLAALATLDKGGLHDPELADHLARAMRFLMNSRPVRPRYCRFQLTEFELLGAIPRERVLKYKYDRLSLEQINPEQSAPSIQFGFGGDSPSNSVDPNGLSRAIFGTGPGEDSASADYAGTPQAPGGGGGGGGGGVESSAGLKDTTKFNAGPAAHTHTDGEGEAVVHATDVAASRASFVAEGEGSQRQGAYYSGSQAAAHTHDRGTFGTTYDDDDDDPGLLNGLPPLLFKDHHGNAWHRMPQPIGAGAFAEVFMVVSNTGTLMAAKCIRLNSSNINLEDVVAEVNTSCRLFNDFIVNYTGWSHTSGYLFLLMEYMPGGTLQKLISGFPKGMPMQLARHYAADALKGLAYLHRHNIIHADVKPQNVLLSADGGCKISDFGSSLTRGRALQFSGDVFQLRGTPFYMSPEVASGASPSMRSDMWSYGVCVYEILTGSLPWKMRRRERHGQSASSSPMMMSSGAGAGAGSQMHSQEKGMRRGSATPPPALLETVAPPPQRSGSLQGASTTTPAVRSALAALADSSLANDSKLSLNTSAADSLQAALQDALGGAEGGGGSAQLAAVLPATAGMSTNAFALPDELHGEAGAETTTATAAAAAALLNSRAQDTKGTLNWPSVTFADGFGTTTTSGGEEAEMETWSDLPPLSDARFVQGIITGEIAPRVTLSSLPSKEAFDLVMSCLQYNLRERPTAVELINHPFFFT